LRVKKLVLPMLAIALLGGLWVVMSRPDHAPQAIFATLDGKQIVLADLKGKMVLVNFWATSCPSCVAEMPKLADTYRQYQARGFEVVAVAMPYDPPGNVVNYARENALPFPVALDMDGSLARQFGDVDVTPTAWIIDRQGLVVQRVMGELDFPALQTLLNTSLGRVTS
jgi:peroxiredoxin